MARGKAVTRTDTCGSGEAKHTTLPFVQNPHGTTTLSRTTFLGAVLNIPNPRTCIGAATYEYQLIK